MAKKKKKDEGHDETESVLSTIEQEINAEYAKAEAEIQDKLDDYLSRFEIKDKLKKQAVENGQITQAEYDQWRVGQIAVGQRWEEMKDTISDDLTNTAEIAKSISYGHMPEVYAINHNYGTYQVEQAALVDTSYTLYDRQSVEHLFKGGTFYHKAGRKVTAAINSGKQKAWDKRQVQSVMTQALLQGESIGKIATRLSKTVGDKDRKACIRNARTMATGVQNAGRVDSYERAEKMGINLMQEWVATLDNRTRHEHRVLDGQRVKVGEKFHVDGYEIAYPADPTAEAFLVYNCRCTLVPVLKGFETDSTDLSLRNTNHMEESTYEEWKNAKTSESHSITKQDEIETTMKAKYNAEYASYAGKKYNPSSASITSASTSNKESQIVIPDDVQKSMETFKKKYGNASTEHYLAINANGQTIYESSTKGRRNVSVPKSVDEQMEGGYSIHNHTAKAVFSAADVKNYEKYGEHGFVFDNEGNEYILYNLNPVSKYKAVEKAATDEEYEQLMPFYSKVSAVFDEIDETTTKNRREYVKELMDSGVDRETRQSMISEWMSKNDPDEEKVAWLEEHAEEYGFVFKKKKR